MSNVLKNTSQHRNMEIYIQEDWQVVIIQKNCTLNKYK